MKALAPFPWLSLMLKMVGAILLLTSLIDFITLFTTVNFEEKQTILAFTTGLVDRGFIPLVGLIALFLGFWSDLSEGNAPSQNSPMLRLFALVVASLLGLLFLVIVPWHVITTREAAATQISEVDKRAELLTSQVEGQVKQLKGQGPQQLDAQLNELENLLNSGQLTGTQLEQAQQRREQLRRLKSDPKALDAEMEAQIAPKRIEELNRIKTDSQKAKDQTQGNAMRSALRTGLNSLLLAIGYVVIGWTGLRQMLYFRN